MMNDRAYWDAYYEKNPPRNNPSDFAKSILAYVQKGKYLVDLGCGNGRDSLFFTEHGLNVLGVDNSQTAIEALNKTAYNAEFICDDFTYSPLVYNRTYDYFYSRFTVHAISESEQEVLLANVYNHLNREGLFFIEVRSVKDDIYGQGVQIERNAFILDNHYRRFIVNDELTAALTGRGFKILYNEEARGFAVYGDANPIVIRVIAQKH